MGEHSAQLLVRKALSNAETIDALKTHPSETLRRLEVETLAQMPPALTGDKAIYRMIVGALGAVVIMVVSGALWLAIAHQANKDAGELRIPDLLTALGSTAIGALAGLLAPSPTQRG